MGCLQAADSDVGHVFLKHDNDGFRQYRLAIEVKSWRDHHYAEDDEIFQVLYKAAALQRLLPEALASLKVVR